jgi:hypothetical protein
MLKSDNAGQTGLADQASLAGKQVVLPKQTGQTRLACQVVVIEIRSSKMRDPEI